MAAVEGLEGLAKDERAAHDGWGSICRHWSNMIHSAIERRRTCHRNELTSFPDAR
jgi:hypothetical protein